MHMHTNLLIGRTSILLLDRRNTHLSSRTDDEFMETIEQGKQPYLPVHGCNLALDLRTGLASLQYNTFLPRVPSELMIEGLDIFGAKISHNNIKPTRARAGYYESKHHGNAAATVENVLPYQQGELSTKWKWRPLYAQNITVTADTLAAANLYYSQLVQGKLRRAMIYRWS